MGLINRITKKAIGKRDIMLTGQSGNGMVSSPFGNFSWTSGAWGSNSISTEQEMSRLRPSLDRALAVSAMASRCIDLKVNAASSRKLQVINDAGEKVPHFLEDLFNKSPNASQSAMLFRASFWQRLNMTGQVFIIMDRGLNRIDDPKSAWIHYGSVQIILNDPTPQAPHGSVKAFKIAYGKEFAILAPSEVLWIRFPDPTNPWGARAPITAALDAIGLTKAAREWQAGQLANGGNPSGIVYVGQPDTEEDYYGIREEVEAALTGPSSASKIAVVAGPIEPKFMKTSFSPKEMEYLNSIGAQGDDIALAMGIPLDLVGGQRTYQNADAARTEFWETTVGPELAMVASEIDHQMLVGQPLYVEFDLSDVSALQEAQDSLSVRVNTTATNDIITIDEARAALGQDVLPDYGHLTLTAYRAIFAPKPVSTEGRSTPVVVNVRNEREAMAVIPEGAQLPSELTSEERIEVPVRQIRGVPQAQAHKTLDRLEAGMNRAVKRLAEVQLKDAGKRLNRYRSETLPTVKQVFDPKLWTERAYDYLLPAITAAMDAGATDVAAALGSKSVADELILKAAENRATTLANLVNETTSKVLEQKLAAIANFDGLTVNQFSDALAATFSDLSTWRADSIARTEMVGGYNGASRMSAVESGVTSSRIWVAELDDSTRESHADLDGYETKSMDDEYPNGLMFPGDPDGDPDETVNCRCVEQYTTDNGDNADNTDASGGGE